MNAPTRIGAVVAKEFRHLGRDPRMLAAVVLLPIMLLVLFSYALSFDIRSVSTIVIDQDQSATSQRYLQGYEQSDFFDVMARGSSMTDADEAFATSTAKVAVIIPAGFEGTIEADGHAEVAVLVDGTEPNSARVARSYSVAINQLASTAMTREWAESQGIDVSGVGTLDARIRTWYNPDQRSSDFLIPGLMVVILAIVTIQQTAVTLVRERTLGTEEQLEVSPMHKLELMIGKLIPWTLLALVDVVVIVAIGVLVLDVPLRGSVAALAVGAVLFILANLGMGLAVSAVAPSEDTANIAAMTIALLPSFMLSGFVFPLNQMPVVLQWISAVLPARYMVSLSRGVFLKGAGFAELWPDLLALAIAAAVLIAVSTLMYSRKARR